MDWMPATCQSQCQALQRQQWTNRPLAENDKFHKYRNYDKPRQHIKKQRYHFANRGPSSQSYDFSSGHVQMWELDHKEGWMLKNWRFWTVVLEKTLESSLDWKIKPVNPKVNQTSQFEYSLKALMLKLKLQYFGLLIETANSLENTLMLGKIEGKRRRGQQRMRWLDSIIDSMNMSLREFSMNSGR